MTGASLRYHPGRLPMWDRSRVLPEIVTLDTPELGDRSYVILAATTAVVVDPQRDTDRVLAVLSEHGAALSHVLETHIHNDYISGGPELCRLTGAVHVIPAGESVGYPRFAIGDGEGIACGALTLRARHTPGHTSTHMTYLLEDDGGAVAAFTGGSMLLGSVGRTDLAGPGVTEHLSRLQHRSARRLSAELPDRAAILPTHGFGSLCSAGFPPGGADSGDARRQRAENPALLMEENAFVARLISGLDAYPRYYAHMAPRNREGAGPVNLDVPRLCDAEELAERARDGEWVIDLRERRSFAARHIAGTLAFELSDPLTTYLGWLFPWGSPLSLIGASPTQLATAQRTLARIGIERITACGVSEAEPVAGDPWAALTTGSYPVATFADLAASLDRRGDVVLDVRLGIEWRDGHLANAFHVPLHELFDRLDEVPTGRVWVHCAAGYRAAVASSMLARAGRHVVLVSDQISNASSAGLDLVRT